MAFDVVVGKGDIDLDQRVPGVLDRWTWSARMMDWRRILTNADGRKGSVLAAREDGLATVTPLRRGDGYALGGDVPRPDTGPLPFSDSSDQRPPWLRRADGWDEDTDGEYPTDLF